MELGTLNGFFFFGFGMVTGFLGFFVFFVFFLLTAISNLQASYSAVHFFEQPDYVVLIRNRFR